jgi:hypothetical protein
MAGHKPSEKKKMMGGGRLYAKDGVYAKRKPMKKGKMPRYGMYNGGNVMEVAKPN